MLAGKNFSKMTNCVVCDGKPVPGSEVSEDLLKHWSVARVNKGSHSFYLQSTCSSTTAFTIQLQSFAAFGWY